MKKNVLLFISLILIGVLAVTLISCGQSREYIDEHSRINIPMEFSHNRVETFESGAMLINTSNTLTDIATYYNSIEESDGDKYVAKAENNLLTVNYCHYDKDNEESEEVELQYIYTTLYFRRVDNKDNNYLVTTSFNLVNKMESSTPRYKYIHLPYQYFTDVDKLLTADGVKKIDNNTKYLINCTKEEFIAFYKNQYFMTVTNMSGGNISVKPLWNKYSYNYDVKFEEKGGGLYVSVTY